MKSITSTFRYPFVLFGTLRDNNHNSFISTPTSQVISFEITKSPKDFNIQEKNQTTIINFNTTQTLSQLFEDYKKAFEILFAKIYEVKEIPGLTISVNQKLDKYDFGALLVASIQALSKYYSLKLDDQQTFEIIKKIYKHLKNPPTNFFVQTLTALLDKPIYFNHKVGSYQTLDLKDFNFLIFDLDKKFNSTILKDFTKDKKYKDDIEQGLKRVSFVASQAQKSIFQKANIQLGENLTKNQKAINELGFKNDLVHELLVSSTLSGAYGAKALNFQGNLYFILLTNQKSIPRFVTNFRIKNIKKADFHI